MWMLAVTTKTCDPGILCTCHICFSSTQTCCALIHMYVLTCWLLLLLVLPVCLQAGTMEVMINHLPGTPDGVARAPDGSFWAALLVRPPPATKVMFGW